jgi:hypothetical protein
MMAMEMPTAAKTASVVNGVDIKTIKPYIQ